VFDAFLSQCQIRVDLNDMAFSTFISHRKLLQANWRPAIGHQFFLHVSYSTLVTVANAQGWKTKKTYNNGISAMRCAFEFGFKNFPDRRNPAEGLDTFRIKEKDQSPVDPFSAAEAEAIILGVHEEWGEAIGNFDEFRIFTGLRQSEQIALRTSDYDPRRGTLHVQKAVVMGLDKDRTKTSEDRVVELCPRARSILDRQLQLREAYRQAGKLDHDYIFFKTEGDPIRALDYVYVRWRYVLESHEIRYREPYHARHTSVSWNLMVAYKS
jgi:integrase